MAQSNNNDQQPIRLGWHAMRGETVLHLWKVRHPMKTAVSSCGQICTNPLDFVQVEGAHCPACESMEELRSIGPANQIVLF